MSEKQQIHLYSILIIFPYKNHHIHQIHQIHHIHQIHNHLDFFSFERLTCLELLIILYLISSLVLEISGDLI